MPVHIKYDDLNSAYEKMTAFFRCECIFVTALVGGQPATEEGIRAYVAHHLKIEDEVEREKVVQRILHEEVEDTTAEGDEIPEGKIYGLNAVRRDEYGPFLGDWMIKACLKQAASRSNTFKDHRGTKGNWAEAGRVRAILYSLQDPARSNQIYIRNSTDHPAETTHERFSGRVQTPRGAMSIMHVSEICPPGSRFAFEFRFLNGNPKLTIEEITNVLGLAMNVGLGSARSLERGRFHIESCEIELEAERPAKSAKKEIQIVA